MKPDLTIAIPTFGNLGQLKWCVKSLFSYTDYPFRVVIVNNNPGDAEVLDKMQKESSIGDLLSVLQMPVNMGWMGGVNAALADCDTRLFCMLNDDVVFIPGRPTFWRLLTNCFEAADVGAVGPCSNFVAGCQSLMELDVPELVETKLLIGFCMVIRTELLKRLGGLEETLPGGDDLDLWSRVRGAGYRLVIRRDCYLHHIGQQTGRRLFGDQWDSTAQQDSTNNALIRKHGVEDWYDLVTPAWDYLPETKTVGTMQGEEEWILQRLDGLHGKGLNLGCGNKKIEVPGIEILGVDIAKPGQHGTGGRKFTQAAPDIVGDATVLDFVDLESQDVIVAEHLLEHLVDLLGVLENWYRALKFGGTLLLAVPDHNRTDSLILDCTHVHAFTIDSLRRLVSRAGFRVWECESLSWGVVVLRATKEDGDE